MGREGLPGDRGLGKFISLMDSGSLTVSLRGKREDEVQGLVPMHAVRK